MTFLVSLIPLLVGCFCLAWAMPKHHRQWFKRPFTKTREQSFRVLGWSLLAVALVLCIYMMPFGLAVTFYLAVLTVAIISTALASTYWAKSKRKLSF